MKKCLYVMLILLLSGCYAPNTHLVQPEFRNSIQKVKKVGVIIPSAIVKELDISGLATVDQDASTTALAIVQTGVVEGLGKNGFEGKLVKNKEDLLIFQNGYKKIIPEIRNHFPGSQVPATVPSKMDDFAKLLKNNDVDCVLAVEGLEHVSSAGRKAKMMGLALLGVSSGKGLTYLYYNLFCEDGKPMFYDLKLADNFSISNQDDVSSTVSEITKKMLLVTKNGSN